MIDIHEFPKIDAHIHISLYDEKYVSLARRYNMRMISVNTDAGVFKSPSEQESVSLEYLHHHSDMFAYIATFRAKDYLTQDKKRVLDNIDLSIKNGAVGVKIWKNIGMELRDADGEFIMASDSDFDDLYLHLTKHNIPLLAHLGEPKNCWLPFCEMTSERNRLYFTHFPEFYMFEHPDYPSYDEHIEARDKILQKFPYLNFIGAHFGSMEWSIEQITRRLNLYSNFTVDAASRINHLQFQSQKNYSSVRNFMIEYADRIIYGSDVIDDIDKMERIYNDNWLYLATDSNDCSVESNGRCRGLNLPSEVLEKIYFTNAMNKYTQLQNQFNQ